MKRKILNIVVPILLVLLIKAVAYYIADEKTSFIDTLFLFIFFSILAELYNIMQGVNDIRQHLKSYYEEICQVEGNKVQRHNYIANKLEEVLSKLSTKELIIKHDKSKAESLRAQARTEESDAKAMGLELKAKREDNLTKVIESGLIAMIGMYYHTTWDNNQNCLRISNFDMTDRVAVFYPKSNKLNFNGNWSNDAANYLAKHVNKLESETKK